MSGAWLDAVLGKTLAWLGWLGCCAWEDFRLILPAQDAVAGKRLWVDQAVYNTHLSQSECLNSYLKQRFHYQPLTTTQAKKALRSRTKPTR